MGNTPFDPSKFTVPTAKPLPVILLLDVSGSMSGEKIHNLNAAVSDMVDAFADTENGETEIWLSIITFGADVKLHQPLTSASNIRWQSLSASGMTPLGTALAMAKAMIGDKDIIPSRAYRPVVVLVSDGGPTDSWERPLNDFIGEGRSAKCDRMAMAIGADADEAVLVKFSAGTGHPMFYAENAKQLRDFFKFLTMSVTIRAQSQTPNVAPDASVIGIEPTKIDARQAASRPSSSADGGYW